LTEAKDEFLDVSRYTLRVRKKFPMPVPRSTKKRNPNRVHAAAWWDRPNGELITLCGIVLHVLHVQASAKSGPVTCGHCLRVAAGKPRTYGVASRRAQASDVPGVRRAAAVADPGRLVLPELQLGRARG
jgi:hypothetical protein